MRMTPSPHGPLLGDHEDFFFFFSLNFWLVSLIGQWNLDVLIYNAFNVYCPLMLFKGRMV